MSDKTTEALAPCPWCASGTTEVREGQRIWSGGAPLSEPVSVSVRHWCSAEPGQPSRMIERIGRDRESAIAAWNRRAAQPPAAPAQQPDPTPAQEAALDAAPLPLWIGGTPANLAAAASDALRWLDVLQPVAEADKLAACRTALRQALERAAAPAQAPSDEEIVAEFSRSRFGVFRPDGSFEEIPNADAAMRHPRGMEGRWVGGDNDAKLVRCALLLTRYGAAQTGGKAVAWITKAGLESLRGGDGPVRAGPERDDETDLQAPSDEGKSKGCAHCDFDGHINCSTIGISAEDWQHCSNRHVYGPAKQRTAEPSDEDIAALWAETTLRGQFSDRLPRFARLVLTRYGGAQAADTQRLDWLEAHPRAVQRGTGYHGAADSWFWFDARACAHRTADSLRGAIDAAIAADRQPGEGGA